MSEKYEFGSRDWIEALCRFVRRRAEKAGDALRGVHYSSCEVFTNVPAQLGPDPSGRIAWHLQVRDGVVECREGELEDPDRKIVGDYAALLPLARTRIGDDPEAMRAKAQKVMGELVAAGKLSVEDKGTPRPAFLDGLHDDMVDVTA